MAKPPRRAKARARAPKQHRVVSHQQWLNERKRFLAKEKKFTRLRDQLNEARRALSWEQVEKPYRFDGPSGSETLADLFQGRSQLVVYHFMFPPEWEEGCKHCSFWADNFNPLGVHLNHRDTSFVAVSRAPLAKLERFKQRMGWSFKWVSSGQSDFNYDYHVAFTPQDLKSGKAYYNYGTMDPEMSDREGVSVFYQDSSGAVFHTYSTYARGIDMLNTAYHYLDLVPKGRDEKPGPPQAWLEHHDRYRD
jgi:predicted dithiol-disulfide oxidoreductase (DUF899 family)